MRTTYIAKEADVTKKWYVVDATDLTLGRLASEIANILRGKNKPTYTPHVDGGDHVIIINCADAVLTGNKLQNKKYYRHTGYVGHLKEVGYDRLMAEKPEFAMQLAVKGMIPSTHNGREQLTRLRVYAGAEHVHAAQQPTVWDK